MDPIPDKNALVLVEPLDVDFSYHVRLNHQVVMPIDSKSMRPDEAQIDQVI